MNAGLLGADAPALRAGICGRSSARMCAAFTAQMADFSISIEKSSHLSFLKLQGNV